MKIGIDASRANLPKKTGTEWYAYHVIEEFKKMADPEDQFILYSKEPLTGPLAKLPTNFSNKVLGWAPGLLWTQLRLAWEMLWHAPDVLFVPAHTIPIISPQKTITTIHDVGFERFKELYATKSIGPGWLNFLIQLLTIGKYKTTELDYHRWSTRLAIKKATQIITISNFSKDEIIHFFGLNQDRISVIYNAPNDAYTQTVNEKYLELTRTGLQLPQKYFLFVGRLEEKKNVKAIVDAYGLFLTQHPSDVKLVLVGQPGLGYSKIKKSIEDAGLQQNVIQLSWQPMDTLVHIMKMATAFIFPSTYEGFGIPIVEAMLSGTPVITSNYGSMKEVAKDSALLVDPNDIHDIAQALHTISTDVYTRTELIEKGHQRANDFSWHKTAKQTLAIIHSK